MITNTPDWDALSRSIQDIVDRAVNARDFSHLSQTIRHTVSRTVDVGTQTVRKTVHSVQQKTEVKKNLPVLYGSTKKQNSGGIAKIASGTVLSGGSFMLAGATVLLEAWVPGILLAPMSAAVLGFLGGIGLIFSGAGDMNMVKRFGAYRKALGDKTQCSLEKLAAAVGRDVKFVRKEVTKMIQRGWFIQGHLDKEKTLLITSHETYRNFEASRLEFEKRQREAELEARKNPRDARVQEVLDKGNAFVAQIRKCNDDIPGEEISAKMDRMEEIVRRIFRRAETNPEIIPDLKKLMDYYLPMTVKLLTAYADMDAQPVQGDTIQSAKREIEETLDTLNLAFEKLLDDLFRDTALDVSSDITVLQTLLAQEGLTDDFADLKKQKEI